MRREPRKIELLAPAKNLTCGLEAVNHGADAVYIGAPKFGARAAAGNSLQDIATLVQYAHLYNVRIYVTLNTLLHDKELMEAEQLIWQLYQLGVDALIIQDMGITQLHLPPIPLHASTQTDNRTPEKVRFLAEAGFKRVVLARELSIDEVQAIHHAAPRVELEAFVHGALCVSFSGQCYISQACFGRSANRGACAQFCRLPFTLSDADGTCMARNKHLLSLRDLNLSEDLESLLDAGVTSLKIEGRLKEVSYIKNITAYYRSQLDALFARRTEYVQASSGTCRYTFTPQLGKSFNRGFTTYFSGGRQTELASMDSPKSMGEQLDVLESVHADHFTVSGKNPFHNGDGICFFEARSNRLQGFLVNRVEGNRVYPHRMPALPPDAVLYRNLDHAFEQTLAHPSAERKIGVEVWMGETSFGYVLTVQDADGNRVTLSFAVPAKQPARTAQTDHWRQQLEKLGNTPFTLQAFHTELHELPFIPPSLFSQWRRLLFERLLQVRRINYRRESSQWKETTHPYPLPHPSGELTYLGNVMNRSAAAFYHRHGITRIAPTYETQPPTGVPLMFTRYCLRYELGECPVHQQARQQHPVPYYLTGTDGKRFRLEFDCRQCQMQLYPA
ncbi:MAG: U32 family peptidase [Prevotellaceae bacterium]|jgi:putative protease|nr:U32 family peptidase [Prevotellaceae bacterium]